MHLFIYILWGSLPVITNAFKFTIPHFTTDEWSTHNQALKDLLNPLHHDLSQNSISAKQAAQSFSDIVVEYCASNSEFVDSKSSEEYIKHEPKSLEQARKVKNQLRKKAYSKNSTENDRKAFRQAIKAVSQFKKKHEHKENQKTTKYQETLFRKDMYGFSKQVCNGSFGNTSPKPTFTKDTANTYYNAKYSRPVHLNLMNLNWFPYVQTGSDIHNQFNMSPVKPRDIRSILKDKKATSAPGPDGLMYGILKNLPCTHHVLATLFTKMLSSDPDPPDSWSTSNVSLIYKANDPSQPENFRMIPLTSCISKVFHQVLANRSVDYLTSNHYIRKDLQKAFINGINGCIEHNILLHEVISHAKFNHRTVHITFFDLADAFGSVSHELINFSLQRFRMPDNIVQYVNNLYCRLNGIVKGPSWKSNQFRFA